MALRGKRRILNSKPGSAFKREALARHRNTDVHIADVSHVKIKRWIWIRGSLTSLRPAASARRPWLAGGPRPAPPRRPLPAKLCDFAAQVRDLFFCWLWFCLCTSPIVWSHSSLHHTEKLTLQTLPHVLRDTTDRQSSPGQIGFSKEHCLRLARENPFCHLSRLH